MKELKKITLSSLHPGDCFSFGHGDASVYRIIGFESHFFSDEDFPTSVCRFRTADGQSVDFLTSANRLVVAL